MSKPRQRSQMPRGQILQLGDFWYGDDQSMLSARQALVQLAAIDPKLYVGDDSEEPEDFPDYAYMLTRHSDVAVLSLSGSMVSKETFWNRYVGLVSYQEARNAAIVAAEAGCRGLLLDIDTNGGSAEGIGELSDFLSEFDRTVMPVFTYTGTKMLSAGYWVGCVGRRVFSSSMANSGSIGVVSAHISYARMLKEQGIDVTMFRQGEFKALGSPYETLDDKAKADIEARMKNFYEPFLSHVSANRGIAIPALIETAAEGRVFMGSDAVKAGLVDEITTFDKAVSAVISLVGARQPTVSVPLPSTSNVGMDSMKRHLNDAGLAAVQSGLAEKTALADPKLSEEVKDKTPEELATEEAAAAAALAEKDPKVEPEATPAPAAKAEQLTDQTLDKIIALSGELAETKSELKRLQASEHERAASMGTLMKICGDAINKMELPLSRSPTSTAGMSAETLISTYHRTLSDFNGRMKIGAQAEVPGDSDLGGAPKATAYVPGADCVKL